ncbi:Gfo/Idh/MocA family oxidoreductase [Candidatus Pelagibacter bacterium]|jgi:predicted dehydrogenase|nr:Gfo/Idh/MocA family oxidoreductase [Candidatus Pelagibacter bacterium]
MKNKKKIRAGVIGLGVGLHQARILASHPECELVSICDYDENKLSDFGSELPGVNQTQKAYDILSDPQIDLVCIASYDEFHYQQVMTCLKNGKNVYVEKPICLSKDEIKNIRKILKDFPELSLSSNMVLRTCPLFSKVKDEVNSKKMGKIYHLEADYLWGRKEKIITGWRAEADFYSIIHGAAVHMIDLVLWITKKEPVSVKALGSNIVVSGTKQKHNDFAVLLLEFRDKMSVKISAHGGGVHPHFHALKVFGSESTFIHDYTKTLWIESTNSNEEYITENAPYPAKTMRGQALISFVNSLIYPEQKALILKEEVFKVMSICLAAEQAVKSKDNVTIEYL